MEANMYIKLLELLLSENDRLKQENNELKEKINAKQRPKLINSPQDIVCIERFILERIVEDTTGSISKTELNAEFKNWYENTYGRTDNPKTTVVHAEMDKKYRKSGKRWVGVRISYEFDTDTQGIVDDDNDIL